MKLYLFLFYFHFNTTFLIAGYAHCGCADLPPVNENTFQCNFCKEEVSYDINLNQVIPQFPPPSTSANFELTCFHALNAARFFPASKCQGSLGAQFFCGCPNAPEPPVCSLCLDQAEVPDPDKVVWPDGGTCQDVIDILATGVIESCGAIQATAGVYCGCEANIQESATFDLPYRSTPCRVCENFDRELLPDTTIRYQSAFEAEVLGYTGLTTSCGEV